MKIYKILPVLVLMLSVYACAKKTNKTSRQFENKVKTTALTKDGKEVITYSRNFYVFESKGTHLFDEKGFFISEKPESEVLAEAVVKSGVRSVIQKYNLDSLVTINKMKLGSEIESLLHATKAQNGNKDFSIRFSGILMEKITPVADF